MPPNDMELRFDGQVAIITGAGGGLGRTYAISFAARGAKVVVNDLGGSSKGEGKDSRAADVVVAEIRKSGGTAVANYNSVEEGDKIVQTALENFGRVDILVNNAGILRDKSFARISDSDWDLVHNVHLRGSFLVTRAAFPHMKKQGYGRIIMTSSTSGIYGNFGQANYSAAKLGLVGLCNTIAIEGRKYNIHCNTIAPMGATRLTQDILPPDLFEELKPELVSPVVLWLSHEHCEESGSLIEAAGGWFCKYRWERTRGCMCRRSVGETATPEDVRDNWETITDFSEAEHLESNEEDAAQIAMALEDLKEGKSNSKIANSTPPDVNIVSSENIMTSSNSGMAAIGHSRKNIRFNFEVKDVILYALSVGCTTKDERDLKYLYEGHEDFQCLPTFTIVPAQVPLMATDFILQIPNLNLDLTKLLHGEQYVEVFWPIPTSGTLTSDIKIVDILDKGSGAVIIAEVNTWDESLHLVAKTQWVTFAVGSGNFNGPRNSTALIPLGKTPSRAPDKTSSFVTSVDQAALYRLNGDFNPLHIDDSFAAVGGFESPILHGLCSYGIAARTILREYCDDDFLRFKAIKARFAKPVIPGQTLVTSMWREDSRVHFETHVKETGQVCLSGGYVDIVENDELPPPIAQKPVTNDLMVELTKDVEAISPTIHWDRGVLTFVITIGGKPAAYWTFDFKLKPKMLYEGVPSKGTKPDSVIIIEDEKLMAIFKGKETFKDQFLKKELKIRGSLPLFSMLNKLFTFNSQL